MSGWLGLSRLVLWLIDKLLSFDGWLSGQVW